jgi:tRNA pseudouridine32 synthase / 23S rRNA pseudouridine746 synthase
VASLVESLVAWLAPQPPQSALPDAMPSPFDDTPPHPLAATAALELQRTLASGVVAPGIPTSVLHRPEGGKMFGVLLVRDARGRVGTLKAFSGQLAGTWLLPGFVPPVFDPKARELVEPASDVAVKRLTAELEAFARSPELQRARQAKAEADAAVEAERTKAKAEALERHEARRRARAALLPQDDAGRQSLSDESHRDDRLRRTRRDGWRRAQEAAAAPLARLERKLKAIERLRRLVSQEAMRRIHDTYLLTSASGKTATPRQLFAPGEPPWGAGDCAAPKLIAFALASRLTPLALAEFWWGPPPPSGARVEGMFFPACREKCGPILPFLLDGVAVAPRRTWRPRRLSQDELTIIHADERLVVVEKPPGLLSVPARDEEVRDSVQARLVLRFPRAERALLVHRLDLDTSGLLVAALDLDTYRFLQAQFSGREVHKGYVAWVEGSPTGDEGEITLPLRVDLEQRPRQVVDFVHGRKAVTLWRVLERRGQRTRLALFPRTGRTHQLRVHAAHQDGLGAPIVGDRLYGTPGPRLLLHAEALEFRHPDGRPLTFRSPAPF